MALNRTAVAALVGGIALLIGGGSALAARGSGDQNPGDRTARCEAVLTKIAQNLGVSVAQLEADVKARLTARVDAALAAGLISPDRATKLKQRIAAAEPCHARGAKPKVAAAGLWARRHGLFRAAAGYLGLTPAQLQTQLPGTSLAALASTQPGKSVEGLEAAMLAPAKARLAKAVAAGLVSPKRADQALERLEKVVARLVQVTFPST
jgi:hypothetical protein